MEETHLGWRVAAPGGRWRDLRSQPLTAYRQPLIPKLVGSGPRHDSAASGRDAMTSHPLGSRADAIVITSHPNDRGRPRAVGPILRNNPLSF